MTFPSRTFIDYQGVIPAEWLNAVDQFCALGGGGGTVVGTLQPVQQFMAGVDFTAGSTNTLTLVDTDFSTKDYFNVYFDSSYQGRDTYSFDQRTQTIIFSSNIPLEVSSVSVDPRGSVSVDHSGSGGAGAADGLRAYLIGDYAELRVYVGTATQVYITGLVGSVKPSGIAGLFQYDPTDTTSEDNGGTIIVRALS